MVTCKKFGKYNGQQIYKYTIKDKISVEICTFGATILSIKVPNKHGRLTNVALGYKSARQAAPSTAYLGATVGRCCNRIAGGKFVLDETPYTLPCNDGQNHLHGGPEGFAKRVFNAEISGNGVVFSLFSPDCDQGYPADVNFSVKYSVEGTNLIMEYFATTNGKTLVNPTNHAYFNLSGRGDCLGNFLQIFANEFLPVENLIPTGEIRSVKNTPFDFTAGKFIGEDIFADDDQLACVGGGYDHNFCLHSNPAARAYSPKTGIALECYTDRCGLQFYSGNFLNERGRRFYKKHYGFCLETQCYPDAVNNELGRSPVVKADCPLQTKTIYAFSVFKTLGKFLKGEQ